MFGLGAGGSRLTTRFIAYVIILAGLGIGGWLYSVNVAEQQAQLVRGGHGASLSRVVTVLYVLYVLSPGDRKSVV